MIPKEEIYRQLISIRKSEEALLDLFNKGLINGTVHTCIGQETIAVALMNSIDKEKDIVFSNHRAHGHFIAYSDKIEELIYEVMGKEDGICGGIGGSQHLYYKNFYTNGIQGGIVPSAIGAGLAEKIKNSGAIVLVFLGDGTMGQGVIYEGFNIASLWSVPILFILEDNGYAQTTKKSLTHAGSLSRRAEPFNIKSAFTQDQSVENLFKIAKEAVNYVRENTKPFFLHLETYRFSAHSKGDDLRDKNEIALFKANDPLMKFRSRIDENMCLKIESDVDKRINDAISNSIMKSGLTFEKFMRLGG